MVGPHCIVLEPPGWGDQRHLDVTASLPSGIRMLRGKEPWRMQFRWELCLHRWWSSFNLTLTYGSVGRGLTGWGCFPTCANMYFFLIFVLKPKARTGISKPYNVKQIKTTNAQEAEAAIRCLLEARGGRCSPRAPSRFCFSPHILAKRGLEKNRTLFLEAVFSKNTL